MSSERQEIEAADATTAAVNNSILLDQDDSGDIIPGEGNDTDTSVDNTSEEETEKNTSGDNSKNEPAEHDAMDHDGETGAENDGGIADDMRAIFNHKDDEKHIIAHKKVSLYRTLEQIDEDSISDSDYGTTSSEATDDEVDEDEDAEADEKDVLADPTFASIDLRSKQKQTQIFDKYEAMAAEHENNMECGFAVPEEEVDFSSGAYDDSADKWVYIVCKKGEYDGQGNLLTEEEMQASAGEDDSCFCECIGCQQERETGRMERYERRCAEKEVPQAEDDDMTDV